jgi:serine/threonine protein kinase
MGQCVSRASSIEPLPKNFCNKEVDSFGITLPQTFDDNYQLISTNNLNEPLILGNGSFSKVFKCQKKSDLEFYAVKYVSLDSIVKRGQSAVDRTKKEVRRGVGVLINLSHPSIICLKDYFESPNSLCVVLELAGIELYDHVVNEGKLTEASAATILRSVVEGIHFMHEKNLVHRDLKPENIVLGNDGVWKIIDFGFSRVIKTKLSRMKSFVGTMNYVAPEVVARKEYNSNVDVWSIGVITFVLIAGYLPFNTSSEDSIQNHNYEVTFKNKHWNKVSFAAKTFVARCLSKIPEDRPTPAELLQMSFLNLEMHRKRKESLVPLSSPTRIKNMINSKVELIIKRNSDGDDSGDHPEKTEEKTEEKKE